MLRGVPVCMGQNSKLAVVIRGELDVVLVWKVAEQNIREVRFDGAAGIFCMLGYR